MNIINKILQLFGYKFEKSVAQKVQEMAGAIKLKFGLRHEYVICDPSGSGALLVFQVREWCPDHFIVNSGAIYPYHSLGGYFFPPDELGQKIRATESNLKIATRVN